MPPRRSRFRAWLRRSLWAVAILSGMAVLAVALLPSALSSRWVRERIEARTSQRLGRAVEIADLRVGWSGETLLEGLEIADDPAFSASPILSLRRLRLRLNPRELLRRRLSVSLDVEGLGAHLVRNPKGRTNLEVLLEHLVPPREPEPFEREPSSGEAFPVIPFEDVAVRVSVDDVSVLVEDRSRARVASVEALRVRMHIPSLREAISLDVSANLRVDDAERSPVRFGLRAERLLTPAGSVDWQNAAVEAEGTWPGGRFSVTGDLGISRGRVDAALSLERLMEAMRPFLPPEIAGSSVEGELTLTAALVGQPHGPLEFETAIAGSGLGISGTILGGRTLGPADVEARHAGAFHPQERWISVRRGEVRIQERSRVVWSGSAHDLDGAGRNLSVVVGPVELDLGEIHALIVPFLPHDFRVAFAEEAPSLTWKQAAISCPATSAPISAAVEALRVRIPRVSLAVGGDRFEGTGLEFRSETLNALLKDFFPAAVRLEGGLRADRVHVDDAAGRVVDLKHLEVPALRVELDDAEKGTGILGAEGRGSITESVSVAMLEIRDLLRVDGLRQVLGMEFEFREGDRIETTVRGFGFYADAVRADVPETLSVRVPPSQVGSPIALDIGSLRASAHLGPDTLPAGTTPVEVEDFILRMEAFEARAGETVAAPKDVRLSVPRMVAQLEELFPRDVEFRGSLEVGALDLVAGSSLRVENLNLSAPAVRFSGVRPAKHAPFGVAGTFHVEEAVSLGRVEVPALLDATVVRQSLLARGNLDAAGSVHVALPRLEGAASIVVETPHGPAQTKGQISGEIGRLILEGTTPGAIDLEAAHARLVADGFLDAEIQANAGGLGARSLDARGTVRLDLRDLARRLPRSILSGATLTGTSELQWKLAGRIPTASELDAWVRAPLGAFRDAGVAFVNRVEVSGTLDALGADLALSSGERLSVGGVFTQSPFELVLEASGRDIRAGGSLRAAWIEALPTLGVLEEPLRATVDFELRLDDAETLTVSESLSVDPLGLDQRSTILVSGLDRLLRRGLETPLPLWLTVLGGEASGTVRLAKSPRMDILAPGFALSGPLEAIAQVRLTRGEEVLASARLRAENADVQLRDAVHVKGLESDIALEKRYRIGRVAPGETERPTTIPLSEEVLRPGRGFAASPARRRESVPGGFGSGGNLGLDLLRVRLDPLPIELRNLGAEISFRGGLPSVDRFQTDLLGGTLVGFLHVSPSDSEEHRSFRVDTQVMFTGLDADRLVSEPGRERAASSRETGPGSEVSGQFALSLPIRGRLDTLLSEMDLEAELTRIGPHTLDRALYALDPTESNEAIVRQRGLLRIGSPRWVEVAVRNGNLSLAGEVQVGGARLDLPRIDRLNIADVPGVSGIRENLTRSGIVFDLLTAATADTLVLDKSGGVRPLAMGGGVRR